MSTHEFLYLLVKAPISVMSAGSSNVKLSGTELSRPQAADDRGVDEPHQLHSGVRRGKRHREMHCRLELFSKLSHDDQSKEEREAGRKNSAASKVSTGAGESTMG